jgi:hypothetical protein
MRRGTGRAFLNPPTTTRGENMKTSGILWRVFLPFTVMVVAILTATHFELEGFVEWAASVFIAFLIICLWPKRLERALFLATTSFATALLVSRIVSEEGGRLVDWIFAIFFGLFSLLIAVGTILDKRDEASSG